MTRLTVAWTLSLLLLSGVASAQSETWDCGSAFDIFREADPLITVTLNDDLETGKLYVLGAGAEYDARYEMSGSLRELHRGQQSSQENFVHCGQANL